MQIIEVLYRKYAGVLYDKCVRMLSDRQEAEDAVHETFEKAYLSLGQFRYGGSHLPWLFRIATNVCLKVIRSKRRIGSMPRTSLDDLEAPVHSEVSRLHYQRILKQVAISLDERSVEILVLFFIDGMSQEEIANVVGISRRAVVKRLAKLRREVGLLLEDDNA